MSNTLTIKVDQLETVLTFYNQIKVYRAPSVDGAYVEITNVSTRINLNTQDSLYNYVDIGGLPTDYYQTSYFNSLNSTESALSGPLPASLTLAAQLVENMQVVLTLSETIANTSGVTLGEVFEFYFTTTYNPMYTSIRRIKLDIGKWLDHVPDDTINLAIFEASREADYITFVKEGVSAVIPLTLATTSSPIAMPLAHTPLFIHARRMWATCKAEEILLANVYGGTAGLVRAKRLGDFSVDYDPTLIRQLLEKVNQCMMRWEGEVNAGGRAIQTPVFTVKGELDIDRPNVGRSWDDANGWPMGNGRVRYQNSRRWLSTYVPRRQWGGWGWWTK